MFNDDTMVWWVALGDAACNDAALCSTLILPDNYYTSLYEMITNLCGLSTVQVNKSFTCGWSWRIVSTQCSVGVAVSYVIGN